MDNNFDQQVFEAEMDALFKRIDQQIDRMIHKPVCYAPEYCYCDKCVANWKKENKIVVN